MFESVLRAEDAWDQIAPSPRLRAINATNQTAARPAAHAGYPRLRSAAKADCIFSPYGQGCRANFMTAWLDGSEEPNITSGPGGVNRPNSGQTTATQVQLQELLARRRGFFTIREGATGQRPSTPTTARDSGRAAGRTAVAHLAELLEDIDVTGQPTALPPRPATSPSRNPPASTPRRTRPPPARKSGSRRTTPCPASS